METTFFDVMKWLMVLVWFIAAIVQVVGAIQIPKKEYDWIKYAWGIVGLYWCFYYLQSSFFRVIEFNHQVWVRTPLLITGGLVAACGIYTLLRRKQ